MPPKRFATYAFLSECSNCYRDKVIEEFKAFDPYKLDRIWAIMFDNLRSILKNRGGNDFEPEHTRKRKRQKDAGTAWI